MMSMSMVLLVVLGGGGDDYGGGVAGDAVVDVCVDAGYSGDLDDDCDGCDCAVVVVGGGCVDFGLCCW